MSATFATRAPSGAPSHARSRAAAATPLAERNAPLLLVPTGRGERLEPDERRRYEARLGANLADVHVHRGSAADAAATALDAEAFTVGSDVVIGRGGASAPGDDGVLVHELTHVLQQRGAAAPYAFSMGAIGSSAEREASNVAGQRWPATSVVRERLPHAMIQRQPRGGTPQPPTPRLDSVVVDQAPPRQTVTLNWSSGPPETARCSTGKGHCCVDASAAIGAAATVAGTQAEGSNLTPVGTFTVTEIKEKSAGGVQWWTQFVDARSIALHKYSPVDGTPLSHGCVRLDEPVALRIFHGAVKGRTRVIVRNLPVPRCDHPTLIDEWRGDFETAGTRPPDGESADPAIRREERQLRTTIREERRALRSALDTDDPGLDTEIAELRAATGGLARGTVQQQALTRAEVARRIPRCVPTVTTEESRTGGAVIMGLGGNQARAIGLLTRALQGSNGLRAARSIVHRVGRDLWTSTVTAAEAGGAGSDDRPLYWARLEMTRVLRSVEPVWMRPPQMNPDQARRARVSLLESFERASRGMDTAEFRATERAKRIVVAGFDPFGLSELRRGNPSGAAALDLDGELLRHSGGVEGRIQSAIFPVRYADFDAGVLESFMQPFLAGPRPVDMIITVSMGGGSGLELEEVAGRRRSTSLSDPENLGRSSGGSLTNPAVPPGLAAGPEFLRTNIPQATLDAMRRPRGQAAATAGERTVTEIRAGETQPRQTTTPTQGSTAVEGSGGGFLSNEIFYRTRLLQRATQPGGPDSPTTLVGHLHTPLLATPGLSDRKEFDRDRNKIIQAVRDVIIAALPKL